MILSLECDMGAGKLKSNENGERLDNRLPGRNERENNKPYSLMWVNAWGEDVGSESKTKRWRGLD